MGGRPPYGYKVVDTDRPHSHPRKAAEGRMVRELVIDGNAAPVVAEIFQMYMGGPGLRNIASALNAHGVPCPSAHSPAQNSHRAGDGWTQSVIGSILDNIRYTGYEIWNIAERQRPYVDPENPSLGWVLNFARAPRDRVVRSAFPSHPAIVPLDTFAEVQRRRLRPTLERNGRESKYPSSLRGRVRCGICGRKMSASAKAEVMRFSCRSRDLKPEAQGAAEHPASVYVREEAILEAVLPTLHARLGSAEAQPGLVQDLVDQLRSAGHTSDDRAEWKRRLDKANREIATYIAAIEAGAVFATIIKHLNRAGSDRVAAERLMPTASHKLTPQPDRILEAVVNLDVDAIDRGNPDRPAALFKDIQLEVTYYADNRLVSATFTIAEAKLAVS